MISDEIKQSLIDIVHQETWKTASLATAAILAGGAFIIFLAKNWLLNWIQNKVSHEFNQKLEAYKSDLQKDVEGYKSRIQIDFEVFKLTTDQAQDRRTRSNENEYNACIECWNALQKSFFYAFSLINQPLFPNAYVIKKDGQLYIRANNKDFLIEDHEREDFRKNRSQEEQIEWLSKTHKIKYIEEYENICVKSSEIIMKNSIFIEEKFSILMCDFLILLLAVCCELREKIKNPSNTQTKDIDLFMLDGNVQYRNIERIIRSNLHIRAVSFSEQSPENAAQQSPAPQPSPSGNTLEPEPTAPK